MNYINPREEVKEMLEGDAEVPAIRNVYNTILKNPKISSSQGAEKLDMGPGTFRQKTKILIDRNIVSFESKSPRLYYVIESWEAKYFSRVVKRIEKNGKTDPKRVSV
jgi:hypothetical protein